MKRIITALLTGVLCIGLSAQELLPYQNPELTAEERAADLLGRLNVEQKVALMNFVSPAIPELGIRGYNWWNEALHGSARSGLATVFPQSIGMAASFDDELLYEVFDATSTEQRIKYFRSRKEGRDVPQYYGLSVWTPNINIFRDPRWGRGQETYGEDPYLTMRMGYSVVTGLQGTGQGNYDKLHACLKHYAVHSGPESTRHIFNAENISYRDLMDTYLYAFKKLVQTTDVKEVMCAYNRFEGDPCCGSDKLLTRLLREDWGYQGLVVSDCWAISNFYREGAHNIYPGDAAKSSAKAVLSGTDLECGDSFPNLVEAVKRGEIKESELDVSVLRVLKARFELGEMDCDNLVSWSSIPESKLACEEHDAIALKMARETMTLLTNNGVLPLAKSAKYAVIGPNADDEEVLWGNYNGFPNETVTPLEGIIKAVGRDNVIFERGCEWVADIDEAAFASVIEKTAAADAYIFVGGISPRLEGEEMDVNYEGFMGGDRTTIELPKVQRALLSALHATGKPVVLVNLSGSAMALAPETESCDAILQAWYGGQEGGQAVADVLFGDYNPAGRLPVTFYKDDSQLPDFSDYDMEGHTYRYFRGEPLFHFGYGLSYSNFKYKRAALKRDRKAKTCTVTVPVTNVSNLDGEEVVQIYIRKNKDKNGANLTLRGFKRVPVKAGQTVKVEIPLTEESFEFFNEANGKVETTKGRYTIFYGPSSDIKTLRKRRITL